MRTVHAPEARAFSNFYAEQRAQVELRAPSSWQAMLLLLLIAFSVLYSLPNLFGEDPALQIQDRDQTCLTTRACHTLYEHLCAVHCTPTEMILKNGQVMLRFCDNPSRLKAQATLKEAFPNQFQITPIDLPATPPWLLAIGARPLRLGLDLRGGTHFLLELDTQGLIEKNLIREQQALLDWLAQRSQRSIRTTGYQIQVRTQDNAQAMALQANLALAFPKWYALHRSETLIELAFSSEALHAFQENVLDQTIRCLRKRAEKMGSFEPLVQRKGQNRIVVELPGVQAPEEACKRLSASAFLEAQQVSTQSDPRDPGAVHPKPPPYHAEAKQDEDWAIQSMVAVPNTIPILDAYSTLDSHGNPQVVLHLSAASLPQGGSGKGAVGIVLVECNGAQTSYQTTTLLHPKKDLTAADPVVVRISKPMSPEAAKTLSFLLRSEPIEPALRLVSSHTIGPLVCQRSLMQGVKACWLCLLLLTLLLVVYYRLAGLLTAMALLVHCLLLLSLLSLLPNTEITLSGLTGIVLAMGLMVDSSLLILEQVHEAFALSGSVAQAISTGYKSAWRCLADAHITTALATFTLYTLGSGAMRSFAAVLLLGQLTATLITLLVTQLIPRPTYPPAWRGASMDPH